MGNRASLRKRLKFRHRKKHEEKENFSSDVIAEDFEGTGPDSYEKLIAWMIEMSQNEEVDLTSNNVVEHLARICAEKQQRTQSFPSAPTRQHSLDSNTYHAVSQPRTRFSDYSFDRTRVPFRQHSYDAATFHSVSPARQSSFDSNNGLLTVNASIRQHSTDSSCSSRSRSSRPSHSREDLLDARTRFRRTMLSRQGTVEFSDGDATDYHDTSMDISGGSSFEQDSDADVVDPNSVLLNKGYQETSFIRDNRNVVRPKTGPTYQAISNSVGDLLHKRTGFGDAVRSKSKSLSAMRRIKSETRTDDEITPINEIEEDFNILEDKLLDGNIADILYSVEALWPKGTGNESFEIY